MLFSVRYLSSTRRQVIRQFSVAAAVPRHVGVLGLDVYFPKTFVAQEDLEKFDAVGKGKYTNGLGQSQMAFCDDREDINSLCLTATQNLLEKYNISPSQVGRLDVGTETILDKSKSVKTTLMNLFRNSGNADIEGMDTTNACYGGTQALFNAVNWVESSSWDGRYAVVVAGDIAVYESGPARPTGGAGVIAMLIGPNAPLVFEPMRSTYMEDAYDFYKPNLESEYPVVDGKLSITCYLRALDSCYAGYKARFEKHLKQPFDSTKSVEYAIFHSPYTKLVMRSYARLLWNDFLSNPSNPELAKLAPFKNLSKEESYVDRNLQKVLDDISVSGFNRQVQPSTLLARRLGNTYCASLYGGLLSLLSNVSDENLQKKRILMFSYGSGLAATMFSLAPRGSLASITKAFDFKNRLDSRIATSPEFFNKALALREKTHAIGNYVPTGKIEGEPLPMFKGTYQLSKIDELKRRTYARV